MIVETDETATVAELIGAAERQLGQPSSHSLWSERAGQVLEPRSLLGEADVRWGDRLVLVSRPAEPTFVGGSAMFELVVTSGPCAGQRWSLGVGSYKLGRDSGCDVHIEDRSLSRSQLQVDVDGSTIRVTDLGSTNGTAIDGEALRPHVPRVLSENDELELGRSLVRCHPLGQAAPHQRARLGLVDFNRPPRVNPRVEPFEGNLPTPPSRHRKVRLPIAASLVPLVAGIVLSLLLKNPIMLVIAGLSPLMAIGSYFGERHGGKTSFAQDSADFKAGLQAATQELDAALTAEVVRRRIEAPDAPVLIERLRAVEPSVWERRPGDPDFLHLRLGVADLPAHSHLEVPDGGDESLRDLVERELASRREVASVPLAVDLAGAGVLGLVGDSELVAGLARWLIVQAAALHSPSDVLIVALLGERAAADWEWLKWLPHLRPERVGLTAAVAIGSLDAELLLAQLRDVLAGRLAQGRKLHSDAHAPTQILAFIDERAGVDRALVSATLRGATDVAACAIWLGSDRRNLPAQVGAIVEVEGSPTTLTLTDVQTGAVSPPASTEALSVDIAGQTARLLAPLRDVGEMARAGDIPRQVGLLELLGLSPPRADELAERWRRWHGTVRVTVGVGADGPLTIDLDNEGPHALIAGTTGSGKSELLRTLVAAAAAVAPPNRLAFLLVDYKGGAAFAPCAGFPHVVDVISDLDEHLAERALVSLKAELKRREHTLAEYGARDHKELVRNNPDVAPPLLVIAVDEFAKLRAEVPEFVDGVVDIAQRGRSLGVHMVLAAQTLGNAFTTPIRASTNLRVALRVAEESESEQIIGSPAAARIPSGEDYRGRAFARTGHSELREFQAAYVSGRTVRQEHRELTITPFALGAAASSGRAGQGFDSDSDSDLTALAAAARQAQRDLDLQMPEPPWLPVLSELVSLEALPDTAPRPFCVAIGIVDVPHMQRQDPLIVDLPTAGNVVVYGGGGSGKTTFLTSMAVALAMTCVPDELRIYGLDAGSGRLACLEALPHCGGVIPAHDEERVDRLLRELVRRIDRREEARGPLVARTVLFLDDLGAFAHQYDRPGYDSPYERLQRVFAGGRAAGVHIVCSASRRGALTAALAAHVGQRFALRMPTDEDMVALGLDGKKVRGAKLPVGRGFTQESLEFQVAAPVANEGTEPFEQAAARLARASERIATRMGRLPAHVERSTLGAARTIDAIPLGLSDEDLRPVSADVSEMHFLVVGPYRSGRSTALVTLAAGIRAADPNADMRLLAPRRSPLRDLDLWNEVASSIEAGGPLAVAAHERLEADSSAQQTAFVFIDDGGELSQALVATQLEQLVRLGRDGPLRVIAAVETSAARGIGVSWIRELRKEGQGLLLQPDLTADGDLLGARLPRRVAVPLVPGRGFLVSRGSALLIQVAD